VTNSQSSGVVLTEGPGVIFWDSASVMSSLDMARTSSGADLRRAVKAARRLDLLVTRSESSAAAVVCRRLA